MGIRTPLMAALSAANSFSPAIFLKDRFNLSIWGTFSATVTVQRSFDGGVTWLDVDTFSAPEESPGFEPEGALYRAGIKTGQYVSGAASVRLGQ